MHKYHEINFTWLKIKSFPRSTAIFKRHIKQLLQRNSCRGHNANVVRPHNVVYTLFINITRCTSFFSEQECSSARLNNLTFDY